MNLLSVVVNTDVAWCHLTSSNIPSFNFKSSLFTYFVCFEISWLVKVFPGGKKGPFGFDCVRNKKGDESVLPYLTEV